MNLESFQIFIEVYLLKSFAEVAKRKNVAPSSVTRIIASLESELGFKLFQRTTRKISTTEKGEEFFRRIQPIYEELKDIKEKLCDEQVSGTLRLTANTTFSNLFLNDVILKFQKKYPEITFEYIISDKNLDLIDDRIDVGIRFGKLPDSSMIGLKLFDLDYVTCCSPAYLGKRRINSPEELKNEKQVSFYLDRYNLIWKFRKGNKVFDINITPKIKVTGALAIIDFLIKGAGIGVIPKKFIENELRKKELIPILKPYKVTPTEFDSAAWIIYPSREYVPLKVQKFVDFLKLEFNKN